MKDDWLKVCIEKTTTTDSSHKCSFKTSNYLIYSDFYYLFFYFFLPIPAVRAGKTSILSLFSRASQQKYLLYNGTCNKSSAKFGLRSLLCIQTCKNIPRNGRTWCIPNLFCIPITWVHILHMLEDVWILFTWDTEPSGTCKDQAPAH